MSGEGLELGSEVTIDAGPGSGPKTGPGATEFSRGEIVGRYVVLEKVGEGGMGVVHAAYDPELDRRVALKILHAGSSGARKSEGRSRLQREAQAMAQLNHPNVITVHDVSSHRGQVFVAMEFVDGGTLTDAIERDGTGWREVLRLFLQAGRGLQAAHEARLVHRDFKPDNVLVGNDGRVRVTDFGLARPSTSTSVAPPDPLALEGESPTASFNLLEVRLTRTGAFVGTPAYMAPEQFLGGTVDARSDQFGFCAALWEALFRARPFRGESVAALAFAVTNGRLEEPPSNPGVPPRVLRALRRGLATSPDERWSAMGPLLDELERDPASQRRWIFGGVAAALVVGGGITALSLSSASTAPCEGLDRLLEGIWDESRHEEAEAAFEATGLAYASGVAAAVSSDLDHYRDRWIEAYRDSCLATEIRREQTAELHDLRLRCLARRRTALESLVDQLVAADAEIVTRAATATSRLPPLETCSDVDNLRMVMPEVRDPELEAEIERRIDDAKIQLDFAHVDDAEDMAKRALESSRSLGHRPYEAESLIQLGWVADAKAEYRAAEDYLTEGTWMAYRSRDDVHVARGASQLAFVVGVRLARPEEALVWGQLALAALSRLDADAATHSRVHGDLALMHLENGNDTEAQEHLGKALEAYAEAPEKNQLAIASIENNIGAVFFRRGEFARARAAFEKALAAQEAGLGQRHPDVAATLHNLGLAAGQLGELEEAISLLERAVALRTELLGPDHPKTASTSSNLGVMLVRRGDLDGAQAHFEAALSIIEATAGPEHPEVGVVLTNLSDLRLRRGDGQGALQDGERARTVMEGVWGREHPFVGYALSSTGRARLALGEVKRAIDELERALALEGGTTGDMEFQATTRFALARALETAGREPDRVRELVEQAREHYVDLKLDRDVAEIDRWRRRHRAR